MIEDCNKLQMNEVLAEIQMDSSSFEGATDMAAMYQFWKDLDVEITVIPQTGTDARNGYIGAFFADPEDVPTRSREGRAMMLASTSCKESSFSRPMTMTKKYRGKRYTVAPGKEDKESELRFISFGKFVLMATGPSGITPGGSLSVRVRWKATFFEPVDQAQKETDDTPPEEVFTTAGVRVPAYGTAGAENFIYRPGYETLLPNFQAPRYDYTIWAIDAIPEAGDIVEYDAGAGSQTYSGFGIAVRDSKGVLQLTPMVDPGFNGMHFHGDNKYMPKAAWDFTSDVLTLITVRYHSDGTSNSEPPSGFQLAAPPKSKLPHVSGNRSSTPSLASLLKEVKASQASKTSSGRYSSTLLPLRQASWVSPTQWVSTMRAKLAK